MTPASIARDPAYHEYSRSMFDDSVDQGQFDVAAKWGKVLMDLYRVTVQPQAGFALSKEIDALLSDEDMLDDDE